MKTLVLSLVIVLAALVQADFVEETDDVGRVQRQLLQEDEGEFDEMEQEEAEVVPRTTTTTEEPLILENTAGPTEFYFQNGQLPKFKMTVESAIELSLYQDGRKVRTYFYDKRAKGGITGSRQNNFIPITQDEMNPGEEKVRTDDLLLNIDFKNMGMSSLEDGPPGMFKLLFKRKGSMWKLAAFELRDAPGLDINGPTMSFELGSKTIGGHVVEAPVGLSYSCYEGTFRSNASQSVHNIEARVHFPGLRVQVFEVRRGKFGPMWECGELMSIGVWVGLIVTLGFALICAWGFTMLASINTMDRFDDPKGKTIHIPQTAE